MYFVYLAKCRDNSLYTGITTDLKRREKQHNGELSGGAKYTLSRKPVKIVYFEDFENRSLASKRENEIKKMSKIKKIKLIEEKMINNELYEKLKNLNLQDAIDFEQKDRQFLALKNLWKKINSTSTTILSIEREMENQDLESKKIFFYLSLVLANSLVCYQLSGKGEDYWEEFSNYFSDKFENFLENNDIIKMLSNFLKNSKKNSRFTDTKIKRLQKFRPFLEKFEKNEKYFYENMINLRDEISKIMKQKKDAKTIVFGVKMFSYAARNIYGLIYFPKDLLIPIDSRLIAMYEKFNLDSSLKIEDFYKKLSIDLDIAMLHLDGIIWTNYDEIMK